MANRVWSLKAVAPDCVVEVLAYVTRRVATGNVQARTAVVRADLSGTIGYSVYEVGAGTHTLVTGGTLAISDTVYDTVQTGSVWEQGGAGFNQLARLPAACFPEPATDYLVKLTLTFTSGESQDEWFLIPTLGVAA